MRLQSAIRGFAVGLAVLCGCFALSEVILRLYLARSILYDVEMSRYASELKVPSANPKIGHVHRPNASAVLMGVPVRINADGLRDRDHDLAHPGARRIIFLGDSLTFGWGVEESQTFAARIEAMLAKRSPVDVINFGTGNYNTEQEANLFFEKGLKYSPDEVVVFFFINDAEPTPRQSRWELLENVRILTFFWSRVNALRSKLGHGGSFRDYYAALYRDDQPGWIAEKRAFRDLRDVCAEHGIDLRVVMLPELHVLTPYAFAAEHAKVAAFLRDNHIPVLDLAPSFAGETAPERLWVAPDDAHPNAIAHERIAEYASAFVGERE